MKKRCATLCFTLFIGLLAASAVWGADNGTVTINELVWLKDGSCMGKKDWNSATSAAQGLSAANAPPACNLKDGSTAGMWRLPTYTELYRVRSSGSPLSNVHPGYYWTSEKTYVPDYYRVLNMGSGEAGAHSYSNLYNFLVVRNP